MPDQNGKLTAEDKMKAIEWLNSKAKFHNCPSCGANNWTVGDDLLNLLPYTGGSMLIGGPTYPVAFLVCNTCAYVRQYMAIPMGILSPSPEKADESE
jgi:hypothetical protein